MGNRTALYQCHVDAGAKLVDFGGWDMPLHYGSQIDEHNAVRSAAGMFDVSHMTVVDVSGATATEWLQYILANDVAKLKNPGKGLYSCMLNADGGVIDDLIVYRQADNFRMVVNAATREVDLDWMQSTAAEFDVQINERDDLAMLAVQGPAARERTAHLLPHGLGDIALALGSFEACTAGDVFVARTGYTGEDGWEIVLPPELARELWAQLLQAGVTPCGLGARDTLRLEAGLNLYGQDMTQTTTPLVSNLGWTVAWEPAARNFIGREALQAQKDAGVPQRLVGLVLEGRGIMRAGQRVATEGGDGQITSGTFSPTLQCSIALARVPADTGERVEVEIRSKLIAARVVRPPFVKQGQSLV